MSEFKNQASEKGGTYCRVCGTKLCVKGVCTIYCPNRDCGVPGRGTSSLTKPQLDRLKAGLPVFEQLRTEKPFALSAGQALEADFTSYRREIEEVVLNLTQRANAAEQKLAEALALLRDAPGAIDRIAANICTELNALDQLKAELSSITQPAEVKP